MQWGTAKMSRGQEGTRGREAVSNLSISSLASSFTAQMHPLMDGMQCIGERRLLRAGRSQRNVTVKLYVLQTSGCTLTELSPCHILHSLPLPAKKGAIMWKQMLKLFLKFQFPAWSYIGRRERHIEHGAVQMLRQPCNAQTLSCILF